MNTTVATVDQCSLNQNISFAEYFYKKRSNQLLSNVQKKYLSYTLLTRYSSVFICYWQTHK